MNPTQVRNAVCAALVQRGVSDAEAHRLEESLLYREGKIHARSYRAGGFLAMWLIDAHVVQIYDTKGELAGTLEIATAPGTMRQAA